jgi:CHRD domain
VPMLFAAGVWAALGTAGQSASSAAAVGLTARLDKAQEIPKPVRVPAGARGTFTATLVRQGAGGMLNWRLAYRGLSGRAVAAHVHRGRRGSPGPVVIALCGPCRTGATGRAKVSARVFRELPAGALYVNVHTARNAAGELRGQVARSTGAPPTTTGTTTAPPPPPPPTYDPPTY